MSGASRAVPPHHAVMLMAAIARAAAESEPRRAAQQAGVGLVEATDARLGWAAVFESAASAAPGFASTLVPLGPWVPDHAETLSTLARRGFDRDPCISGLLREARDWGPTPTFDQIARRRHELLPDGEWYAHDGYLNGARVWGVDHGLFALHPDVVPGRWLALGLYRGPDSPPFGDDECLAAAVFIRGAAPLLARMARTAAVADAHRELLATLTPRMRDVFFALLTGANVRAIAERLGLEVESVQTYTKRLYKKLNVRSRAELQAMAHRLDMRPDANP